MRKYIIPFVSMLLLTAAILSSCGSSYNTAMSLKAGSSNIILTTNEFQYYMSYYKTMYMYNYEISDNNDTSAFWNYIYEGASYSIGDMFKEQVINYMMSDLAYIAYYNDLGLSVSKDVEASIDEYISSLIKSDFNNSVAQLNSTLAIFGINDKLYKKIIMWYAQKNQLLDYLFNISTGVHKDEVISLYEKNYVRVQHILFSIEPVLDEEENEVARTEEEIAEIKQKADDAYARALAGEEFETLFELSDDPNTLAYTDGYIISQADLESTNSYAHALVEAGFEMEVGDIRLIETEYGYHLIKKCDTLYDVLQSTTNEIVVAIRGEILEREIVSYVQNIYLNESELSDITIANSMTMFNYTNLLQY